MERGKRLRLVVALTVAVIAGFALPLGATAQQADNPGAAAEPDATIRQVTAEQSASLPDIEDEVMCPICGTALNLSESPQAESERAFIRRLIADGQSKDQIKDALVVEYGEDVLAIPGASGFDLTAWIVPGAGIGVAILALVFGIGRWRRSARDAVASGEAPAHLADADEQRLDSDLARYDL